MHAAVRKHDSGRQTSKELKQQNDTHTNTSLCGRRAYSISPKSETPESGGILRSHQGAHYYCGSGKTSATSRESKFEQDSEFWGARRRTPSNNTDPYRYCTPRRLEFVTSG